MKNHLFHDLFNLPQADCLYTRLTIRNHEDIEVRWDIGQWDTDTRDKVQGSEDSGKPVPFAQWCGLQLAGEPHISI